jgi:hypothetical protein
VKRLAVIDKKMKLDLSQWTESTVRSARELQSSYNKTWMMFAPSEKPQHETKRVLKYKKVDKKIRPVPSRIPNEMKVQRQFPHNPLTNLPPLPFHPPEFHPTAKVTTERMSSLALDDNHDLLPEEKKLLQHILVTNERSIAFDEIERGTFRRDYFSDYKMPVIDHVPWQDRNMPLPKGYQDQIIKLLKEKKDAGVYEEAQSSYRSRWFCVQKKNGDLRLVHDLQKLNGVSIRDSGVPPILDEFVETYAGRSIYTVLDMYWGFHARMLHEDSRDMTAFQTPLGELRIVSLPMGYTNSPAEFQACMMFILQDEVPEKAGVFIDDVPIKGPPTQYLGPNGQPERLTQNPGIRRYIWEHLNDVHRILHRIGESGGTVSGKKMQLCQSEVEIVGHKCSSKGREPISARTKKVIEWPRPINTKQVRGFLGLCGTVRIWIKDYSQIAKPLIDLTRKDANFLWGPAQEEAFLILKRMITQAPALKPIDYTSHRNIYLSVDSSIHGIGFILSQEDEQGRRAPARYGSLPVSKTVSEYGQSKLELWGLMRALRHFRAFIVGVKNLTVEVDAASIKGMLEHPDIQASALLNRWIQGIQLFDFKLVHVPAHKHKGPDALSRRPIAKEDSSDDPDPDGWVDNIALFAKTSSLKKTPSQLHTHFPILPTFDDSQFMTFPFPPSHIPYHSWTGTVKRHDPEQELNDILRYLVTQKTPKITKQRELARFKGLADQFYLQGTHMYKRHPTSPPQVVIFNKKRRRAILWEMHEDNAHHGTWAVAKQTTLRYYWPHMLNDIKHHIQSCHTCQLRSTKKMHLPITISQPRNLFSKVYLDVMKMPKAHGMQWLVACRDDLSGVTECQALRRDTAKAIAKFFYYQIILRYGNVLEVVTDNGPSFHKDFKKLLKDYGIKQIMISPYNSQANGVVERGHFNIREALVKLSKDDISQWPLMVQAACFTDRITIRRATGFSPFYLLHGVHPFLPCDLTDATFMVSNFKPGMTDVELIAARTRQLLRLPQDIQKARQTLHQSRIRSKKAFETKYSRRLQKDNYPPGTLVLLRNVPIENTMSIERKTTERYMGPYNVIRQTQGGSYILEELNGSTLRHSVAAFRLIPYIKRKDLEELAQDSDTEKEDNSTTSEDSSPAVPTSDSEESPIPNSNSNDITD